MIMLAQAESLSTRVQEVGDMYGISKATTKQTIRA